MRCPHYTICTKNLEKDFLAPITEFFFQLVAMERFLVEFIIVGRKSTDELAQSDMIERRDTLFAVSG